MSLKPLLLLILLCFCSLKLVAQEPDGKFKFHNITTGTGAYTLEKIKGNRGFSVSITTNFRIKKNVIGINWNGGFGASNKDDILKNAIHSYSEINLLYGREFNIARNLFLNAYAGFGFTDQTKLRDDRTEGTVGFPVRSEIVFKASKWIDVGAIGNVNFNKRNNIHSFQVLLRFNFN
ncbi:hypothetical protein Q2T40_20445 [Winogradskyella maritima]|uniref:Outer membrane protein beta-barrel domain-containing protein n=1 Tax=Winogradskyella maritima TaxID=1517766 RepID=A0ABV8ACP3_9FLAO|nr:hypothetical protein [Winogradskyella maritima]